MTGETEFSRIRRLTEAVRKAGGLRMLELKERIRELEKME